MAGNIFDPTLLWPHQCKAFQFIKARLTGRLEKPYKNAQLVRSILVRMPTGTGKSGVIAAVCQSAIASGPTLVLAPSAALARQLAQDIDQRFWTRAGVPKPATAGTVNEFTPSTLPKALRSAGEASALVATIQSVEQLARSNGGLYNKLKKSIKCVIVDEGHREPAQMWSQAVRGLLRPVILFTATPYRNDHKAFNVNHGDAYAYTHKQAEDDGYVRQLRFVDLTTLGDPEAFVDELLAYYDSRAFKQLIPKDVKTPRVIIRCNEAESIRLVVEALREKKQAVVGVHTGLPRGPSYRAAVPSAASRARSKRDAAYDAIYWVHQNLLLEGIDRPEFCLLALYEPMKNGRALVQQVGRTLRNSGRDPQATAVVLSAPTYRQESLWSLYRKYEVHFESNPDLYEKRNLFDVTVALTPETWLYDGGSYRGRLDVESGPTAYEIRYALAANVFRIKPRTSAETLNKSIVGYLKAEDYDVRERKIEGHQGPCEVEQVDSSTWFVPFIKYHHPAVLSDHYLFQFQIGYSLWRIAPPFILYVSSESRIPDVLFEKCVPEDPKRLQTLFHGSETSWLTDVSLLNMDLGNHSVRRRSLGARRVGEVAPSLNDHMQVCSTATGYTREKGAGVTRRYVGFRRARVSDDSGRRVPYSDLDTWLSAIAKKLRGRKQSPQAFRRFAEFVKAPADTEPRNILIDIQDAQDLFEATEQRKGRLAELGDHRTNHALLLDDACCDIQDGVFEVGVVGDPEAFGSYPINVEYDQQRERYVIDCPQLDADFVRFSENRKPMKAGFSAYVNKEQCFRVVPATPGVVFAHGRFYNPRIQIAQEHDDHALDLRQIFVPVEALSVTASEKGSKCASANQWQRNSLFGLIDRAARDSHGIEGAGALQDRLQGLDWFVCDDVVLTEVADFLGVWCDKRVVLIHGKAFKERKMRSASAFHEVCGQAIKNLDAISPYGDFPESHVAHWKRPWRAANVRGSVKDRIRVRPKKRGVGASRLYSDLLRTLSNPSIEREVWITLGQGFSFSEFEQARKMHDPPPEIVQIVYILQSTWAATASIGATFRVLCSP